MREVFVLVITVALVACTTSEIPQKPDSSTITQQNQNVQKEKTEESVEDIEKRSELLRQLRQLAEEEKHYKELMIQKENDLTIIDEAYEIESKKPYQDRKWDTILELSEYYLKKYYNYIDKDYLEVEGTVIECLYNKDEHNLLIRFVNSSARMTQTQISDTTRAYPLRMKAHALDKLGKKEEAKQTYRKVIDDYSSATRDVDIARDNLDKIERSERETSILKSNLERAIAYALTNTVKTSLSGLGEVKFSMSVDEVKRVKPNGRFDLHGEGECKSTLSMYGCITWKESFYGYDANVTVEFASRENISRIIILFASPVTPVESKGVCQKFKGNVFLSLIRTYGIPEEKDKNYVWRLNGGEIEYASTCIDIDYLLFAVVILKPISGI